jgi:ABC-type dipeptide/oligopeptide/nickel transport system permease component
MLKYLLKRLLLAVPVLFGVSLLVFLALRLLPGDPAQAVAGIDASQDVVEAVRRQYGLDRPLIEQYLTFLGNLLRLDLGRSNATHELVVVELWTRLPNTAAVAVGATVFATVVGVTCGVVAARFRRTWPDYVVTTMAIAGLSVPSYVLGLLMIVLFAVMLRVLPANGASSPAHFLMPIITVGMVGVGVLARQTRSAVLDVLGEDYIRTARAKGLAGSTVLMRHALRNALIPVATVIGLLFGQLLGGTVIIETVFGIPGIGRLMVDRIFSRDYPTVQGAVLLIAFSYVFVNILVDFVYVAVDKRVRIS